MDLVIRKRYDCMSPSVSKEIKVGHTCIHAHMRSERLYETNKTIIYEGGKVHGQGNVTKEEAVCVLVVGEISMLSLAAKAHHRFTVLNCNQPNLVGASS